MSTAAQPIVAPPPTWRRWMWAAGAILVVVVVLVVSYVVMHGIHKCGDKGDLYRAGSECVGITDGSDIFDSRLQHVEKLILAENDSVLAGKQPYVTIVVMLPMTVTSNGDVTIGWIRRQLEGALLAQQEANHTNIWENAPKLRVLLANAGTDLGQWGTVVDRIESRKASEHIVAVTGIGLSVRPAKDAVQRLSELKMPVFASTLTADDIDRKSGFVRVSPTDSQEARAAAEFVKNNLKAQQVAVVEDRNPDDLYARTLAEQFSQHFFDAEHKPVGRPEPFLSNDAGVATGLTQMVPEFCGKQAQVIYFAGRATAARMLIEQLSLHPCSTGVAVVTGDDLSLQSFGDETISSAAKANVKVYFTGLTHPESWKQFPAAFSQEVVDNFSSPSDAAHSCEPCFQKMFRGESLDDGVAQISHDSVVAAIEAVRNAASGTDRQPSAEEVIQSMYRLHGEHAVRGASGPISFDSDGNPVDKPIPILQLEPGLSPKFVTSICPSGGTNCTQSNP